MIRTILVPVDGSAHALNAVDFAADLAQAVEAKLVLLHVMTRVGSSQIPEELRDLVRVEHVEVTERDMLRGVAEEIVNRAKLRAKAKSAGEIDTLIETGDPAAVAVAAAKRIGADLITMGRRGLGGVSGLLLGSMSHKVLQLAECPCATVK